MFSWQTGKVFCAARLYETKSKGFEWVCVNLVWSFLAEGRRALTQSNELKIESFSNLIATILNMISAFLFQCQHIKPNYRALICMSSCEEEEGEKELFDAGRCKGDEELFKLQFQCCKTLFGAGKTENIENVCIIRILCKSIGSWIENERS